MDNNTWSHLTVCKQIIKIKLDRNTCKIELIMLKSNTWNHMCTNTRVLTHLKIKLPTNYSFTNQIHKQVLALNNQQGLIGASGGVMVSKLD